MLLVLLVDQPKAAGFFGSAFIVVEFPIEDEGAPPFDAGDDGLDTLAVLLPGIVAPRRKAVFADENALAGDAGLGAQFGLDVVELAKRSSRITRWRLS